jgi:hypothetical protein
MLNKRMLSIQLRIFFDLLNPLNKFSPYIDNPI